MNRALVERRVIERLVFVAFVVAGAAGAFLALEAALDRAAPSPGDAATLLRTVRAARLEAIGGVAVFLFGMAALAAGRIRSQARGERNLPASAIAPAVAGAAGLGLVSQMGHGDPLRWSAWPGPGFAVGLGLGGLVAGLVLAWPGDPIGLLRRYRLPLALTVVLGCVGLRLFGSGPTGTGTFINLELGGWSAQPLEVIKLAFVCLLGLVLGEHAVQLRFQRDRAWWFRFPRPRLLALAVFFLLSLFGGLVLLVNDLGPTLVLSLIFLALFFIVTRSTGWVVVAVTVVGLGLFAIVRRPAWLGSDVLATRIEMWLNPWFNGMPFGSQLAEALWAFAAGGLTGQGLAQAHEGAVSAAHTDLMLAHLAEETGLLGGLAYLLLLGAIVVQGLWIAANNREPERVLVGAACALLLLCQWLVIFGGVTGLLPLTGLASPFLSWGKSSTIVFMAAVAILLRLAEDGAPRVVTTELAELRGTMGWVIGTAALALVGGVGVLFWVGVVRGPTHAARGVLETLRDGTLRVGYDPRLEAIIEGIGRGEILDRQGRPLATTGADGRRGYPLRDALGTLLGPPRGDRVLRRPWSLERIHDHRLRGFGERSVQPGAWKVREADGTEGFLFAVPDGRRREADRERAQALAGDAEVRFVRFPAPDFASFAKMTRMPASRRRAAVGALAASRSERSVRLTLDRELQRAVAEILRETATNGEAAAAVVIDVATGHVLARAQHPDVDFGADGWYERLVASASDDPRLAGVYGPWADKTGVAGFYQAGSVAKLFTALAAVRAGVTAVGATGAEGCSVRTVEVFPCVDQGRKGPYFTTNGWPMPVHDHHAERVHGAVDLVEGIAKSCNVYFAQLGLKLGPDPFRSLFEDGVAIGWSTTYEPGEAGTRKLASTAFGQGAAAMNVSQAARLVATVGSGGVYRRCPPTLLLDAPCAERRVVDDDAGVRAILAGMRCAMTHGTAAGLPRVPGVTLYGKTGTADSVATVAERPYGYVPGATGLEPHSWFLALAEPEAERPCSPGAGERLAVAVVIPRGGGGTVAGRAAVDIVAAARELGYVGG